MSLYVTCSEKRNRQSPVSHGLVLKSQFHTRVASVLDSVREWSPLYRNRNVSKIYKSRYFILHKQIFVSKDANLIDVCISQCNLQILKNRRHSWIGHIIRHNELVVNVLEGAMSGKKGRRKTSTRIVVRNTGADSYKAVKGMSYNNSR